MQSLIKKKSKKIAEYQDELLDVIKETKVHSPEESETDPENPTKRKIVVYDYSWRSHKVLKCRIFICRIFYIPNFYITNVYLLFS